MLKEKAIFRDFLKQKGLKLTQQREEILETFLKTEQHLSTEDLYKVIKKKKFGIGQATVFRTLKLLTEAGIAKEVRLGDKRVRFEHEYGHQHHDHLVCQVCSKLIETVDFEIERLQNVLCKKFQFTPTSHRLQIFGMCKQCKNVRKKVKK